jgi:hypothetical protein
MHYQQTHQVQASQAPRRMFETKDFFFYILVGFTVQFLFKILKIVLLFIILEDKI